MVSSFYRSFEDKHRGSRELIKSRLEVYLPFVWPLLQNGQDATDIALDLGCGRGEWLELLTEQGWLAKGVDQDSGMLEACREQNLKADKGDALDYLHAMKDKSAAVITGFHIAEHLQFEKLKTLVEQSFRVLKPGGLLILETPNPENLVVGTTNFYLDPTHERPLPPLLLSFLTEHIGFKRVKTLRLQEATGLLDSESLSLVDVFNGVSPDYAIIAQKDASQNILKSFDEVFSKDYGVSLNELANLYDEQKNAKQAALQTENEANQQKAVQLTSELKAIKEDKTTIEAVIARLQSMSEQLQHNLDLASKEKTEFRDELKVEQQRAMQIMAELSSANEGKAASIAEIAQLQNTIQNLQQSLDLASKEKAEFKGELKLEQQRALQLMEELMAAKEAQAITTAEVTQLQTVAENLQHSLELISKEKEQANSEIEELQKASQHWQLTAGQLGEELEKLKSTHHELLQTNHHWWATADQQNKELEALKKIHHELLQTNHHWWSTADQQGKELAELRRQVDELNHSSHHWWLESDRLDKELQATYKSKSWRITWPLRKLMQFSKWLFCLPARIILWVVRLPKRTARWLLVKLMAYTQKHPFLKERALAWLQNYPAFETKLRQLALARGLKVAPPAVQALEPAIDVAAEPTNVPAESSTASAVENSFSVSETDLSHLTPSARRIYTDLVAAIQQSQKEEM